MKSFPFKRQPDVFYLAIPVNMSEIDYSFFQSQFGQTDEELCYYKRTLIGIVGYRENDDLISEETTAYIHLLPKLDLKRPYDWPTIDEFIFALDSLLRELGPWYLRCEYDCDQYPVEEIGNDIKKLSNELKKVIEFCTGNTTECPSFIAEKNLG